MAKTYNQIKNSVLGKNYNIKKSNNKPSKSYSDIKTGVKSGEYNFNRIKSELEKTIRFDTFQTDLNSLSTTLDNVYNGWQTPETMEHTLSSVQSMRERVNSLNEYQRLFGDKNTSSVTDLQNSLRDTVDNWGTLTSEYGKFKTGEAYAKERDALSKLYSMPSTEIKDYMDGNKDNPFYNPEVAQKMVNEFNRDPFNAVFNRARDPKKMYKNFAYTTSDGYNITWEELYNDALLREENAKILKNPDFNEKSVYKKKDVTYDNNGYSVVSDEAAHKYNYINGNQEAKDHEMLTNVHQYGMSESTKGAFYTEEEKKIFNYLWETQGYEKAMEYDKLLSSELAKRRTAYQNEQTAKMAKENPVGASIASVIGNIGNNMMALPLVGIDLADGNGIEENSALYSGRRAVQTARSTVEGMIDNDIGAFFYRHGLNLTDNVVTMAAGGFGKFGAVSKAITAGTMSAGAFTDTVLDAKERGLSDGQALALGGIAAGAEYFFESKTFESIFDAKTLTQSGWKYFVNNMKTELYGELGTELTNDIADMLIAQDLSALQTEFRGYVASGMSEKEAMAKVSKNMTMRYADVAAGTIFSSGMMSGPSAVIGSARQNSYNKKMGQNIRTNDAISNVFDIAEISPEVSSAYEAYTQYAKKGIDTKNASNKQVGRLYSLEMIDAQEILDSKTATAEEKQAARDRINDLTAYAQSKPTDRMDSKAIKQEQKTDVEDDENSVKMLIESGLASNPETTSYKLATEYNEKIKNGKNLTKNEISKLMEANAEAISTENKTAVTEKLTELGETEENISEVADLITRKLGGEILTKEEQQVIKDSKYGSQVLEEEENRKVGTNEDIEARTETMSKEDAELFKRLYDGKMDIDAYTNAFNLISTYAEKGFTQKYIDSQKVGLTPSQINEIYKAKRIQADHNKQAEIKAKNEATANKLAYKGFVDDSIIEYDTPFSAMMNKPSSESKVQLKPKAETKAETKTETKTKVSETTKTEAKTEGKKNIEPQEKVKWSELSTRQRKAITFVKGLATATGMNLVFVANADFNGAYHIEGNTIYMDVYAGYVDDMGKLVDTIIPTMSHEVTHWMKDKAPELWRELNEIVFNTLVDHYNTNATIEEKLDLLRRADANPYLTEADISERTITEQDIVDAEYNRLAVKDINKGKSEFELSEIARDEIIARSCEDMLKMSEQGKKYFNSLSETQKKNLWDKIKDVIQTLKDWVSDLLGSYDSTSREAMILRQYDDKLNQMSKLWDKMLKESVEANQGLEKSGTYEHDVVDEVGNVRFNEKNIDVATQINTSMTMDEAKQMIERAFVLGGIRDFYDGEYKNGDEWIRGEGASEVAMYVENEYTLVEKYLNKIQSYIDGDFYVEDILEAYLKGTLIGKEKPKTKRLELSTKYRINDKRFYSPQQIKDAKKLLSVAMQRVTDKNRKEVSNARAKILIFAHNKGASELLGLSQAELNKKLRAWSNYSSKARDISKRFNNGVADSNKWTGIENCSWIYKSTIETDDLEKLVKSIKGAAGEYEKMYIARTMLALDTHIDWSWLSFEFDTYNNVNKGKTFSSSKCLGYYRNEARKIVVSHDKPNTVAHEMGHALDYQWARDLGYSYEALTEVSVNTQRITDADEKQFFNNFKIFMDSLTDSSDIRSSYSQDAKEVFARFVARFIQWVDNTATNGNSYNIEYLTYNDKFTASHYIEFVKLLQEKAMLDAKKAETNSLGNARLDTKGVGMRYSEKDYPIDSEIATVVKNASAKSKSEMHSLSTITSNQNKMINRLVQMEKNDSYRGKFTGGKHLISDTAIKHAKAEHGDFLREGLRAQLPITDDDIARHLSALKNDMKPSDVRPSRTRQGNPSIVTVYEINGYTLFAEELTKSHGNNTPSDLIGHTIYKAPTLSTAAFYTTSAQTQPKRQSMVLCEYRTTNSNNLSRGNFITDTNEKPILLSYIMENGVPKHKESVAGLIALTSNPSNFTDKSKSIGQGYVVCKKPFYITNDNRVFSNSDTNVADEVNKLKAQGYDCFIFDKKIGDNYMVAVTNKAQIIKEEPKIVTKTENEDIRYSEKSESIYDIMGERDQALKDIENFKAEIERLNERLKLERTVTGGNQFNQNQLGTVAGHLRNISQSNMDKVELMKALKEFYTFIATSENLSWEEVYDKSYRIAETMLSEAKPLTITDDYAKSILREIRTTRISLDETQKKEASYIFDKHWNRNFMGKVIIADNGTPIEVKWQEWHNLYPDIFRDDLSDGDKIRELYDIIESLKASSEMVDKYAIAEQTKWLANEIYNQYWNVSPIRTTADKYDKQIKRLNFAHRQAMNEMRDGYQKKLYEKGLADDIYYGGKLGEQKSKYESKLAEKKAQIEKQKNLYKKLRDRKDNEIALAKERGKEKLDIYKDNAKRKTYIQRITANALTLNKWLTTNSKDYHIHDDMKLPVLKLLDAIDFSSKSKLERGITTQNDITFSKAFEDIKSMLEKAEMMAPGLEELYGHDLSEPIKIVSDAAYRLVTQGDNHYVINAMTSEELENLDKLVRHIKKVVNDINKFHTVQFTKGAVALAEEFIEYGSEFEELKKQHGNIAKYLEFRNRTPYYFFKTLGPAGMKLFEAFQDGWDKLAFNAKQIIDFTNGTKDSKGAYTTKEVQEWTKETRTFKLKQRGQNGKEVERNVEMSMAQIMALYCVAKQDDAKSHLLSGGMTLRRLDKDGRAITDYKNITLTPSDIQNIIGSLDERQLEVADALQKFMNTVCSEWGNEISRARFGIEQFGIPDYFPIKVSDATVPTDNTKDIDVASMFRLLIMSFTNARKLNAKQSIEIGDIFDIFAQHTSEMAKYNALALPVLDFNKFYSYMGRDEADNEYGVVQTLQSVFGNEANGYLRRFVRDINGTQNVSRDTLGGSFMKKAKVASVAANIRVIALQPTAFFKAGTIMDYKYLAKASAYIKLEPISMVGKLKKAINLAEKHCGIVQWKALGYYDTDISKGLAEKIKHSEGIKDKLIEKSMKGAELADKVTFGTLWVACEFEIKDTRKDLKVGSEEYYQAVAKRLREIIYATQVVDSTMTRSDLMRSPDKLDKMYSAFMSEPTIAYNMLLDMATQKKRDEVIYGKEEAKMRNRTRIKKTITSYLITNLVTALVESAIDAFRDDEDEDIEKFLLRYLKNFLSDVSIIGKLPYLKDIYSMLSGYSSSRMDTQWMSHFVYAGRNIDKLIKGKGDILKLIKSITQVTSDLTGLPVYNIWRDGKALIDNLID